MDLEPIIFLCLGAFLLNLPFGFLRAGTRRLSWRWFAAIHLPVLIIILARLFSGVSWHAIPLVLASDLAGQLLGGMLRPAVKAPAEAAEIPVIVANKNLEEDER